MFFCLCVFACLVFVYARQAGGRAGACVRIRVCVCVHVVCVCVSVARVCRLCLFGVCCVCVSHSESGGQRVKLVLGWLSPPGQELCACRVAASPPPMPVAPDSRRAIQAAGPPRSIAQHPGHLQAGHMQPL